MAPAVTHETITRKVAEEVQTAVNKEIHEDHWHTSVQTVTDEETLEEIHSHNLSAIESRNFEHDDREDVQRRLAAEQAKFQNELVRIDGEHSRQEITGVDDSSIFHHVRELIVPVVQKRELSSLFQTSCFRWHG